jgi:hypothetical protein
MQFNKGRKEGKMCGLVKLHCVVSGDFDQPDLLYIEIGLF